MKEKSGSLLEEWVTTRNYPVKTKNLEQFSHFTSSQTFSKYNVNKKLEHLTTWNEIQRSLRTPWYPFRPDKQKTLAAFFISHFLWCFKRFYEDLKGIHKTSWGTKKKCENNITFWNARDGKSWEFVWTIAEVESLLMMRWYYWYRIFGRCRFKGDWSYFWRQDWNLLINFNQIFQNMSVTLNGKTILVIFNPLSASVALI